MTNISNFGKAIKSKRLSLNMRMDDLANKANITRSTLYSIEHGSTKCSFKSIINVINALSLSLDITDYNKIRNRRSRATRTNKSIDKKVNRFIIFCVEQYASSINKNGKETYDLLNKNGIISELRNDYEDLHGMSPIYLNDYITGLLKE